jgi:uncharacterized membrane protein
MDTDSHSLKRRISSTGPNSSAVDGDEAQRAAPPQSRLVLVTFADEAKVDRAIGAVLTELGPGAKETLYRLAVVTRGADGKVSVRDVTDEERGTVVVGALLGGVGGLAGGPLGVALGAAAGALVGWSAELANEEGVTEFAKEDGSELAPGRRAVLAEVSEEAMLAFEALMVANGGVLWK